MGTNTPRELASLLEEYRSVRRRIADMGAEVAAVTATARSVDGCVSATVGPRGELRDLRIDPEVARRIDLRTLTARILEATALAGDQARERLGRSVAATMPAHLRHLVSPEGIIDVRGLLPEDLSAMLAAGGVAASTGATTPARPGPAGAGSTSAVGTTSVGTSRP